MSKNEQDAPVNESVASAVEETTEVTVEEIEETQEKVLQSLCKEQEEKYLRLAAEYDNFRKRSLREKEVAWSSAKAETAAAFLPVYDNLERALKQETTDEAYAKGIEMTMNQLKATFEKLGVEEIPALGQTFDPELHNAVMHIEDKEQGENTVVEVFQTGFRSAGKVIRFAMVKVAN